MSAKKGKSSETQLQIRKQRYFSEDLKRKLVKELEHKITTIPEIIELYGVSRTAVYKWLYKYSPHYQRGTKTVVEMESEAQKTKQLKDRLLVTEAALGQKQLELDYLNKLLEIAAEELGYDLKKKFRTKTIEWFKQNKSAHTHKLNAVYICGNISRQAHFESIQRLQELQVKVFLYINFIHEVRQQHPGMGLRTMYYSYQPEGIGRDEFIEIGVSAGLVVEPKIGIPKTTKAHPSARYSNLLEGKQFTDVNQIWSSDITYFYLNDKYYYLVFIMDVYSRRIVGYSVDDNMRAQCNVNALKMALKLRGIKDFNKQLIHHSDRGSQYISEIYVKLLESSGILISMCTNVLENAHIERVNGTIKNQYLKHWYIKDFKDLKAKVAKAVNAYNNRSHSSLDRKTPIEFENYVKKLPLEEREKLEIFVYTQNDEKKHPNQLVLEF